MRLIITVDVPDSAAPLAVKRELSRIAYWQQGITITTPRRESFDVDLILVHQA
jgi:hypothetical protein